ncbi:MAG: DNA mismatch repair protein MutS [Candidatus Babeliales bacterium]
MQSATPLMRQYFALKAEYPDALLLFQVGDFYELFFKDAQMAAATLGITLTARGRHQEEPIPLCGVPVHTINHYLPKLVKAGYRVAICDQLEEPKPGTVVRRGVTQVLTPGTLVENGMLNPTSASYLLACAVTESVIGLVFAEVITAQLFATAIARSLMRTFETELARFLPDEIIVHANEYSESLTTYIQSLGRVVTAARISENTVSEAQQWTDRFSVKDHANGTPAVLDSMHLLHDYLYKNQRPVLDQFRSIQWYRPDEFMLLDAATQRNLELVGNGRDGTQGGTLASLFNTCATTMGTRTIKKWIVRPLLSRNAIDERHDMIAWFVQHPDLLHQCTKVLGAIGDIERIVGRIALHRASIHEYIALREALLLFTPLAQLLQLSAVPFAQHVYATLLKFEPLIQLLVASLVDDAAAGSLIKKGYSASFDEMRLMAQESHNALAEFEREEQQRTNISSLKVRYNQVHGYYIEITKANLDAVPADYIRHQTLVGKERFTNAPLRTLETTIVQAQTRVQTVEKELFDSVVQYVDGYVIALRRAAQAIAQLDALLGFAQLAYERSYVRPIFNEISALTITQGKHPVIDASLRHRFIANDTHLSADKRTMLITGPNMGGKSTYLRQVAHIQILAQCGSFVPAVQANLPIVDRIFTRIGAGDDVSQGKSTFLVEMEEAATICTAATEHSLVILDEVGRGTSTYDGIAIAQAIIEYLSAVVRPFCLFATHYHELTELTQKFPVIVNYHAASKRTQSGIVLLYKIMPGIADGSFGIDVARLAQLPMPIIERAHTILTQLRAQQHDMRVVPATHAPQQSVHMQEIEQMRAIVDQLKRLELENLSPRAVYDLLWELKQQLP